MTDARSPKVRFIGAGRAALSLAGALAQVGCDVVDLLGRADPVSSAARGVDVLVIAVPDSAIAAVAGAVVPVPTTAVVHLSGSLGPEVLVPHPRQASMHPLVPLPNPETGTRRLLGGVSFAVDGDPAASELVELLGGIEVSVTGAQRAAYHAAACIAANHVVALLGQVERVANAAGLGFEMFAPLAAAAVADAAAMGPAAALTGPAARGDQSTIERHRAALDPAQLPGYDAGVALAVKLAGTRDSTGGTGAPGTGAPGTDRARRGEVARCA